MPHLNPGKPTSIDDLLSESRDTPTTPVNPGPKGFVAFFDEGGVFAMRAAAASTFRVVVMLRNLGGTTLTSHRVHLWAEASGGDPVSFAMPDGYQASPSASAPYYELTIAPTGSTSVAPGADLSVTVIASPNVTASSITLHAQLLPASGTSVIDSCSALLVVP